MASTEKDEEHMIENPAPRPRTFPRLTRPIFSKFGTQPEEQEHNDDDGIAPAPSQTGRRIVLSAFQGYVLLAILSIGILSLILLAISEMRMAQVYDAFPQQWQMSGYNVTHPTSIPHDITRDVIPIHCHSHNDYWRKIPLFEGLHYGCTGTEADVYLIGDELYVGHDKASLRPEKTLRSMYLDPLLAMLDYQNRPSQFWNGTGRGIFETDPEEPLILLVDLKTEGVATLAAVERHLEPLRSRGYLRYWNGTAIIPGPITVVGTGNTPFNIIASNSSCRDIFFDAPLADIYDYSIGNWKPHSGDAQGHIGTAGFTPDQYTPENSFYASVRYGTTFKHVTERFWYLNKEQVALLGAQIAAAEKQGLKARYWGTPGWPISLRNHVWEVLVSQNTGMLNVDDIPSATTRPWSTKGHHV